MVVVEQEKNVPKMLFRMLIQQQQHLGLQFGLFFQWDYFLDVFVWDMAFETETVNVVNNLKCFLMD